MDHDQRSGMYTLLSGNSLGLQQLTLRVWQVLLPLMQGTLWTLALAGWRHWNRGASLQGHTLGSRIRRWWYEVNNWELPRPRSALKDRKLAGQVQDVSLLSLRRYREECGFGV